MGIVGSICDAVKKDVTKDIVRHVPFHPLMPSRKGSHQLIPSCFCTSYAFPILHAVYPHPFGQGAACASS